MNTAQLNIHCESPFPKSYDKAERDSYDQVLSRIRAAKLERAQ
jgi:hypothetical protein